MFSCRVTRGMADVHEVSVFASHREEVRSIYSAGCYPGVHFGLAVLNVLFESKQAIKNNSQRRFGCLQFSIFCPFQIM